MLNRTEKENLDNQIAQAGQYAHHAEAVWLPKLQLSLNGLTLGIPSTLTSNIPLAIITPTSIILLVAGGLYGAGYYYRTKEKRLIVQRLINEINKASDLEILLNQAEIINQIHGPYLRKERGFYGFTLVQKWIGNKYGHETGNTKSWQEITAALNKKCSELAGQDATDALQRLHTILSVPVDKGITVAPIVAAPALR